MSGQDPWLEDPSVVIWDGQGQLPMQTFAMAVWN